MATDWTGIAAAAMPLVGGLLGRRSSGDEIPGMSDYIGQTLAGQRNAQMFAEAAVDPNSAWFRNLAALFREGEEEAAMRGIRLSDFNERRAMARGLPRVTGERRDEARIGALTDAFRRANISSRGAAHQALLNASRGEAATIRDPSAAFNLLKDYGNAQAQRQSDIFRGIGEIVKKIPWGSMGGDATSGYVASDYKGIPIGSPLYNPNYGGLY